MFLENEIKGFIPEWYIPLYNMLDLLDLCLLTPGGTKGRNNTPPANSILAGPL